MSKNASLLISTCDKFSDLWDTHISFLRKKWVGDFWKVYMVTDRPTDKSYDGVEIIVAESGLDFPMRIRYALDFIKTDYVLLTLDDYFLIEKAYSEKLEYLVGRAEMENIDYLLLYDRRKTNPKKYESIDKLVPIDLNQKYSVNLYPAIWSKEFLKNSVNGDLNPWLYEPTLTNYAKNQNAKCCFSHSGAFVVLDVVRKGKVLHKANSYFKKHNVDIGDRPIISRFIEIKLAFMDLISWYMPKRLFKIIKKAAMICGMKFYSED